jgi:hypothetical protein
MKSIKAALASLLRPQQATDFVDPVLGVIAWNPTTETWDSGVLAEHRPFCFKFTRHKKETAPSDVCIQVARDIAGSPGTIEEQVRLQLSYATAHRSCVVRSRVESLRIRFVVLGLAAEKVSGEVLLQGDPVSSSWIVWHENGVPSLATQHWE